MKKDFEKSPSNSAEKLHAGLALVAEGQVVDPLVLQFLRDRLLTVAPAQFAEVRKLLKPHEAELIPALWQQATDVEQDNARRLLAACALAEFDPSHGTWTEAGFTRFIAEQLIAVSPVYVGHYQELLRPVAGRLVPALSEIFQNPTRGELEKSLTTTLLALIAFHFAALAIFRQSNWQKERFKQDRTAPIWGKPPRLVGGKLLASGYWGIGRKLNYTGEILVYVSFAACAGFSSLGPWLLPLALLGLLTHRAHRDDKRCRAKYGPLWAEYAKIARFRVIPFVY